MRWKAVYEKLKNVLEHDKKKMKQRVHLFSGVLEMLSWNNEDRKGMHVENSLKDFIF